MTHKVNPHNIRVGIIRDWDSRWTPSDITISGEKFRNLEVTENIKIFGNNQSILKELLKL